MKNTYILGTGNEIRRTFEFDLNNVPAGTTPLEFAKKEFGGNGRILETQSELPVPTTEPEYHPMIHPTMWA